MWDQSSSALVYIMTLCRTWAARSNSLSFQLFREWMKWIYLRKWVSGEGQQLDSQNQHIFVRMFVISPCPPPLIQSGRFSTSAACLGVSYRRGNGVAGSAFQVAFVLWNCANMLFFVFVCGFIFRPWVGSPVNLFLGGCLLSQRCWLQNFAGFSNTIIVNWNNQGLFYLITLLTPCTSDDMNPTGKPQTSVPPNLGTIRINVAVKRKDSHREWF